MDGLQRGIDGRLCIRVDRELGQQDTAPAKLTVGRGEKEGNRAVAAALCVLQFGANQLRLQPKCDFKNCNDAFHNS